MTARPAPLDITGDYAALADLFAAAHFTDATRLYAFASDGLPELLVESFCGFETVCGQGAGAQWVVDVLSMQANLPIRSWRFKQAALGIRQADGSTQWRSGYLQSIQQLDADGGLARYRLSLMPGIWLATQARRNRVFQQKPLLQILEEVLAPYAPYVRWQFDTGVDTLLGELAPRPMIVQYQESDYAFITRLMAEEGLGWSIAESSANETSPDLTASAAPDFSSGAAHTLNIFANGHSFTQDPNSAAHGGIRWHQASSQEESDALFDWRHTRQIRPNQTATLSWAWAHKRALVAVEESAARPAHVPPLEHFSDAHDSRQSSVGDAQRYARLQQTQTDSSQWQIGCASSVRSLAVHRWFNFVNYTSDFKPGGNPPGADPAQASQFNILTVLHVGTNNLPRQSQTDLQRSLAQLAAELLSTAPHPALPQAAPAQLAPLLPALFQRVAATGYANCAQLLPRSLPLQAWLPRQPHIAAGFTLPARVVGPQGETTPGVEEIYADANNRVRVAFFWQQGHTPDDRNTCWVPVMQRAAGPTRGVHLLPRIGQEVLIGFLHGQLDQPIVLASAYNGRGEGSRLAREDREGTAAASPFDQSVDARIAGQSNRVGHGNSPVWHGAAGVDHNHAAALLGLRSKEWGGAGFNQLLFDDSDQQLAVQIATTQYTTQLNMGHLRHRADNYRGSFRGTGFEARTDAYGAVRAKQGVMLTTWGKDPATPTGDAAAAQRLMQTARDTGKNLSQAAGTHLSVKFSSDAGVQPGQLSALRDDQAPLAAMAHALQGMVGVRGQKTEDGGQQVPHPTDPILTVAGRGGIGLTATEVQMATGHTHTELAGAHHYTGVAGQTRVHTGQAIGLLGGAIQANNGIGLQLIAGNGDILTQAQSDTLTVASQKDMSIAAGQAIDFAAAKKIVIKTAAGATIEIGSSGINVTAPGSFMVHAASHQFVRGGWGKLWVANPATR